MLFDVALLALFFGTGLIATPAGAIAATGVALDFRIQVHDAYFGRRPGGWRLWPLGLWILSMEVLAVDTFLL